MHTPCRSRSLGEPGGSNRGPRGSSFVQAPKLFLLLLAVLGSPGACSGASKLEVRGSEFTINGRPTFLLGLSYYGALGARDSFTNQDLDDAQRHGFNWIRIWATWAAFTNDVAAVDGEGHARAPFLGKLVGLVADCDRRGMVVDVTLSRGNGVTGPPRLGNLASHQRAVETLVTALKPYRNWYLDLGNERNIRDQRFVSFEELRQLRDAAKRLDPERLLTASHAGGELDREDLARYLHETQLDFLSPHRPRDRGSPAQTERVTRDALQWMRELGRVVPWHYQEPFRRAYGGWQPGAGDFIADLNGARTGGAAGWCFHNGDARGRPGGEPRRSFDLRERRLFEQFDEEERRFLDRLLQGHAAGAESHMPRPWPEATPAEVDLDPASLRQFVATVGGRGCVIRQGKLAYAWGDASKPGDVASAAKPVYAHLLFQALEAGRIPSLDEVVSRWEPRLATLNPALGHKDAAITWRHLATQTSCYGVAEPPGTAFCYNDWQMALFVDLLFTRVYETPWDQVDARILRPLLTGPLGCEDNPTLLAFGAADRAGRLAISPRDFARFGQLYLQRGYGNGRARLREDLAAAAVTTPLPASFPRAGHTAAPMLPGQRTLGSQRLPDNQTEHFGSYSWLWWVNGTERSGRRHWPKAPPDAFAALGHGGQRGLLVMPSRQLVASWNDGSLDSPESQDTAFGHLADACQSRPQPPAHPPDGVSGAGLEDPQRTARLRLIIETDAGGDPDDEQSLVRFLLYANEWDIEGIIANRPQTRPGENRNPERSGLGVVKRLVKAYGECQPNLAVHDPRFPSGAALEAVTVAGYNNTPQAVDLLLAAAAKPDPRPIWYSDWGTDHGGSTNNLKRALDRVLRDRGVEEYSRFKSRFRLSSYDQFGEHTGRIDPPFALWVDTFRPEIAGKRWYHRFSALTARAGGFDLGRDCLTGHGPLGALYPTNTTHGQKEGDTMTFLYLVPTGMNDPEQPGWGSWAGRYGRNPDHAVGAYFWANKQDAWAGSTNRDNTLARWAADLQRDFQARLDWCVKLPSAANHPPEVIVTTRISPAAPEGESTSSESDPRGTRRPAVGSGVLRLSARSGETVWAEADKSRDPDGQPLAFEWFPYPEAGSYRGALDVETAGHTLRFRTPVVSGSQSLHFVLRVTDSGDPPLSRYARLVVTAEPAASRSDKL